MKYLTLPRRIVKPFLRDSSLPKRANSLGGEAYQSNEPVNTNLPMELAFFVKEVSPGSDTN